MAVNKVVSGNKTLIDISDSTVTPNTMLKGAIAYGANGEKVSGDIEYVAGASLVVSSALGDEGNTIVINAETEQKAGYVGNGASQEARTIYLSINGNTATVTDGNVSLSKKVADVCGNADASKKIILSGDLADGTYTVLFQGKDGLQTVGSIIQGVTYTNLLPTAVDCYNAVFFDKGYIDNYYLGGNLYKLDRYNYMTAGTGYFTTGFIPYTIAQAQSCVPIYVKGIDFDTSSLPANMRTALFKNYNMTEWNGFVTFATESTLNNMTITKLGDKYYRFTPNSNFYTRHSWNSNNTKYIRFSFPGSGAGVIITVNEPIE